MKGKIKTIFIGVLIGVIVLPTITFGGSFVSNLIAGKTLAEAIQILAEQIDILIGRVEIVEIKQVEQEEIVSGLQSIINQQTEIIENQQNLIEGLQSSQETQESKLFEQERLEACRFVDSALKLAEMQGGIIGGFKSFDELISRIIYQRDTPFSAPTTTTVGTNTTSYSITTTTTAIVTQDQYQMWQSRLEKVQSLKEQYLDAKAKCGEKNSQ